MSKQNQISRLYGVNKEFSIKIGKLLDSILHRLPQKKIKIIRRLRDNDNKEEIIIFYLSENKKTIGPIIQINEQDRVRIELPRLPEPLVSQFIKIDGVWFLMRADFCHKENWDQALQKVAEQSDTEEIIKAFRKSWNKMQEKIKILRQRYLHQEKSISFYALLRQLIEDEQIEQEIEQSLEKEGFTENQKKLNKKVYT